MPIILNNYWQKLYNNDLSALPVSAGSTDFRGTQLRARNSDGSAFSPIEASIFRANSAYFQVPDSMAIFTNYSASDYTKIICGGLHVHGPYITTDATGVSITNAERNTYKRISVSDVNINGTSVKSTTDLNLPNCIKTYSLPAGGIVWIPVGTNASYLVFWSMPGIGTGIARLTISNSSVLQAVEICPDSHHDFDYVFKLTVSTTYGMQLAFESNVGSYSAIITLVHFNIAS